MKKLRFFNFIKCFGIDYRFPKTSIGIGIRYTMNSMKGDATGELNNTNDNDESNRYYIRESTEEKYKFSNFGVRFCWR